MIDVKWINETIDRLPNHNFIYKIVCFFVGHKLTYKEMYAMLYELNRKQFGDRARELSINKIIEIYRELHDNNQPKGF